MTTAVLFKGAARLLIDSSAVVETERETSSSSGVREAVGVDVLEALGRLARRSR